MSERRIRVLVVDDSAFMRKVIGDLLAADSRIEVVGRARDGRDALEQVRKLTPHVVTLDVEMPRMDGLQFLEELMRMRPTPVVMVSSLTQQGADVTMRALSAGAVDFVTKPSGTISLDMHKVAAELCQKVIGASEANLGTLVRKTPAVSRREKEIFQEPISSRSRSPQIVAVASSTGGPRAIQEILPQLPATFPIPLVIVQHMPEGFTASFAQRLNDLSPLRVMEAYEGLRLEGGCAVIAPGGKHLLLEGAPGQAVCRLSDGPPVKSVKPAADLLFLSVADVFGGASIGVVLTGMGRDGSDGARAMYGKGATILAESPETCVVYGMPRAVAEAGIVHRQLPLYQIAGALKEMVRE